MGLASPQQAPASSFFGSHSSRLGTYLPPSTPSTSGRACSSSSREERRWSAACRLHLGSRLTEARSTTLSRPMPLRAPSPPRPSKSNPDSFRPDDVKAIDAQVLRDCSTAFSSLLLEYEYWVEDGWVEGTIPAELEGTYFRNGPGIQIDSERCRRHAFDGDGMVFSLAIKGGKAFFRNRFVRTQGFVDEQEAGRPLYRTTFSSGAADGSKLFNPLDLSFKNVANTGVIHWAGKLYALWEAGKPYELDPHTLTTLGESDLGGRLTGSHPLAGHYRVYYDDLDGGKPRWVTFGTDVTLGGLTARFYEFDEAGACVAQSTHALPGIDITFVHDVAVTEHYYVLLLGPIEFDWARFATQYIFGRCSIAQCLHYNKNGSARAMLFPRPGRPGSEARRPQSIPVPRAFFPFHQVNAYEVEERMVIDAVGWSDVDFDINRFITTPEYYQGGCRPEYLRVVLDTEASKAVSVRTMLQDRTVEFPMVSPTVTGRRHSHVYFTADTVGHEHLWGPAQALLQVSLPGEEDGSEEEATAGQGRRGGAYGSAWAGGSGVYGGPASSAGASSPRGGANGRAGQQQPQQQPQQQRGGARGGKLVAAAAARGAAAGVAGGAGVRTQQWLPGPRSFCGESMIVPKPNAQHELDAWVLVGVHHAETCKADIVILDAARVSDGPIATIHLPHHLPASLHGSFSPEYLGPDPNDTRVPRWREPNQLRPL